MTPKILRLLRLTAIIILTSILLMAIVVRVQLLHANLSSNSIQLTDYGRDLLVAKHFFESKQLIAPASSIPSLNNTPFYYWIIGSFYHLFSGDTGVKIGFWLLGCGTILLGYVFGRNFDKVLGLTIATYIASSQLLIFYSITVWQPHLVPFFILLWACFLAKFYKKKQTVYLILSVLSLSGTFFLHYTEFLLLPAAAIITVYLISINSNNKKQYVFFLLALFIVLVAFTFLVRESHIQLESNEVDKFSIENLSVVARAATSLSAEKISHVVTVLNRATTLMLHTPLEVIIVLIGILFVKLNIRKKSSKHLVILLITIIVSMGLLFFLPVKQIHDHYATAQLILIAFFPFLFFIRKNLLFYLVGVLYLGFVLFSNVNGLIESERKLAISSAQVNVNQQVAQKIIFNSALEKKQISHLYTPDTNCQIVKSNSGKDGYYCLYSDWMAHGVMYEIEKQLNTSLVELVQYGSNIKPKHQQGPETISYLFCPPDVIKFCQTWVVSDPCVTPIDQVTTNEKGDFVQIYAITCEPKNPF